MFGCHNRFSTYDTTTMHGCCILMRPQTARRIVQQPEVSTEDGAEEQCLGLRLHYGNYCADNSK